MCVCVCEMYLINVVQICCAGGSEHDFGRFIILYGGNARFYCNDVIHVWIKHIHTHALQRCRAEMRYVHAVIRRNEYIQTAYTNSTVCVCVRFRVVHAVLQAQIFVIIVTID